MMWVRITWLRMRVKADCCEYDKGILFCAISGKFPQQVCYCQLLRQGRGVDHPPHIAPRLKGELSYTSIPALGLHGLV